MGRKWGDAFDIFEKLTCQGNSVYAQRCATAVNYGWQIGQDPEATFKHFQDNGPQIIGGVYGRPCPETRKAKR